MKQLVWLSSIVCLQLSLHGMVQEATKPIPKAPPLPKAKVAAKPVASAILAAQAPQSSSDAAPISSLASKNGPKVQPASMNEQILKKHAMFEQRRNAKGQGDSAQLSSSPAQKRSLLNASTTPHAQIELQRKIEESAKRRTSAGGSQLSPAGGIAAATSIPSEASATDSQSAAQDNAILSTGKVAAGAASKPSVPARRPLPARPKGASSRSPSLVATAQAHTSSPSAAPIAASTPADAGLSSTVSLAALVPAQTSSPLATPLAESTPAAAGSSPSQSLPPSAPAHVSTSSAAAASSSSSSSSLTGISPLSRSRPTDDDDFSNDESVQDSPKSLRSHQDPKTIAAIKDAFTRGLQTPSSRPATPDNSQRSTSTLATGTVVSKPATPVEHETSSISKDGAKFVLGEFFKTRLKASGNKSKQLEPAAFSSSSSGSSMVKPREESDLALSPLAKSFQEVAEIQRLEEIKMRWQHAKLQKQEELLKAQYDAVVDQTEKEKLVNASLEPLWVEISALEYRISVCELERHEREAQLRLGRAAAETKRRFTPAKKDDDDLFQDDEDDAADEMSVEHNDRMKELLKKYEEDDEQRWHDDVRAAFERFAREERLDVGGQNQDAPQPPARTVSLQDSPNHVGVAIERTQDEVPAPQPPARTGSLIHRVIGAGEPKDITKQIGSTVVTPKGATENAVIPSNDAHISPKVAAGQLVLPQNGGMSVSPVGGDKPTAVSTIKGKKRVRDGILLFGSLLGLALVGKRYGRALFDPFYSGITRKKSVTSQDSKDNQNNFEQQKSGQTVGVDKDSKAKNDDGLGKRNDKKHIDDKSTGGKLASVIKQT